jgi:hypothetical protein
MWPTDSISLDEFMSEAHENFGAHLNYAPPSERKTTFFCDMVNCTCIFAIELIYLLTAIGLTLRGSSTVHIYTPTSKVHIYTQTSTVHIYTQTSTVHIYTQTKIKFVEQYLSCNDMHAFCRGGGNFML